jgi:hypothetical protein
MNKYIVKYIVRVLAFEATCISTALAIDPSIRSAAVGCMMASWFLLVAMNLGEE